jgi:hypothetical protein
MSYCSRDLRRSVSSCCTVVELESIGVLCILLITDLRSMITHNDPNQPLPGVDGMRTAKKFATSNGGYAIAFGG